MLHEVNKIIERHDIGHYCDYALVVLRNCNKQNTSKAKRNNHNDFQTYAIRHRYNNEAKRSRFSRNHLLPKKI